MAGMKMIVGLGNPGDEYVKSRHNVGFRIIDLLAKVSGTETRKRKFGARLGEGQLAADKLILLKPWQYMNRSGEAVAKAIGFYKLDLSSLLVVLDDMWLEPGRIRIRVSGSAGGHKGLADIIEKLGTEDFARLRVGIGNNEQQDAYDYVLAEPGQQQRPLIKQGLERAKDAVVCWIEQGIDETMNRFNRL
jgi:PTH1 family peptidyl-tRNA hydrolase